ncbi:chloride channel protein, CIC family [Actinopolymorpha cephalotaxi]|uniref:CIC family chloride channel protein n=1 Tax=Actinopolymorpha cephalotaxi TaxID=504797 RepID=A0A1I2WQQ5_9ACTN|nr:chloride channel protein [Actinopolymorpha cephalotaxi]NYH85084.1 CIC family chloride channel protein [Actinopolymorpha cephalotaxi]SFH03708.1 chloride channel protein, CIC family [Actinopolymorpha cephalotaxi]
MSVEPISPVVVRRPSSRLSRAFDWLRGTPAGLVPLALVVGLGAGLGAVAFRYLILWFTEFFSGHADYSGAGHAVNHLVPRLGMFFVVLAPVVGGLIYGPIVYRFAREARGHGVPEVMLAVAERGGRIAPQVAVVKALASALCIGSGGSVGREGPIVQIGSALGSSLGQLVRLPEKRLRLLVACGAAGGISATFNAPIAGVFFAMELILNDFGAESFGAVVLTSVTAAVIGRAVFGDAPFLHLPAFHLTSPAEFVTYVLLGVLAAVVGLGFVKILYGFEDLADRIWRGPEWLRPAVGGLLLGGVLLVLPQMYGVGYPVLAGAVEGHYVVWFLLVLLVGKVIATSLTISIGGSGGVFAPSLFLGAMAGSAFGLAAHAALPGLVGSAGAYGLVGMGAVFAATSQAPITAVIIIFELTGDYSIILPLMAAVAVATALSKRLSRDTIYTLKLRRRGIDILRGRSASLLETLTVAEAMQPVPAPLAHDAPLDDVLSRLAEGGDPAVPVVDAQGAYRGTISVRQAEAAARDNELDATAADLATAVPALSGAQTLASALSLLDNAEDDGLPVLADDGSELVGWLNHRQVLTRYRRQLADVAEDARSEPRKLGGFRVVGLTLDGNAGADADLAGRRISEVNWPPTTRVMAIRRDDATVPVTGDTVLENGDRLSVLVPAEHADDLGDLAPRPVVNV